MSKIIRFADKFDFGLGGKDIPNRMPQDCRIIGYETLIGTIRTSTAVNSY